MIFVQKTRPTVLNEIEKGEKKMKDNKSMRFSQQRSEEQISCPDFKEKAKHLGRPVDMRFLLAEPSRAVRQS